MARYDDSVKQQARSLRQQGLTQREISERLGGVPIGTVWSWVKETPQGERREAVVMTPPGEDDSGATPEPGRAEEMPPRPPPGARVVSPQPSDLDYASLEGHIAGLYKLAAKGVESGDPALCMAIDRHADQAGHAWVVWIRSEPRVAELLRRLMIGTPLGEVIGVHVSIVFAYIFARDAVRRMAAAEAAAADTNGATGFATESAMDFGPEQAAA